MLLSRCPYVYELDGRQKGFGRRDRPTIALSKKVRQTDRWVMRPKDRKTDKVRDKLAVQRVSGERKRMDDINLLKR